MTRHTRSLAVLAASLCLPLSLAGTTSADPIGDTKHDLVAPAVSVKAGDTPAEFGTSAPAVSVKSGDTPAEFGRPTVVPPPPAEFVRSERAIVRDTDELLPIVLVSLALLLAVGGLVMGRSKVGRLSRSH